MKLAKVYPFSSTLPACLPETEGIDRPSNLRACMNRKKSIACQYAEYFESHNAHRIPLFWHLLFTGQTAPDGTIGRKPVHDLQNE